LVEPPPAVAAAPPAEAVPPLDLPPLPGGPALDAGNPPPPVGTPPAPKDADIQAVAAQAIEADMEPPPDAKEAGQIAARVGDEVITLYELQTAVHDLLKDAPRGQKPTGEELNIIAFRLLERMVQRSLILQQARRNELKKPIAWQMINQLAEEAWQKERVPELLKQAQAENEYELKQKLSERGMSLENMKSAFQKDHISRDYLRMKVASKGRVDLPEIRAYYAAHREDAEFHRDPLVTWREVKIALEKHPDRASARKKAEAVLGRLRRGEDFAKVAEAEGEGPNAKQGGLWETAPDSYAIPAVNEALGTLPLNQVSQILEGPESYHLVVVEGRRAAGVAPFEEVQGEIRNKLTEQKIMKEMEAYIVRLTERTPVTYSSLFAGTAPGTTAPAPAPKARKMNPTELRRDPETIPASASSSPSRRDRPADREPGAPAVEYAP
jgi:parvulin-like peptidyl-prolyl isomerase